MVYYTTTKTICKQFFSTILPKRDDIFQEGHHMYTCLTRHSLSPSRIHQWNDLFELLANSMNTSKHQQTEVLQIIPQR